MIYFDCLNIKVLQYEANVLVLCFIKICLNYVNLKQLRFLGTILMLKQIWGNEVNMQGKIGLLMNCMH